MKQSVNVTAFADVSINPAGIMQVRGRDNGQTEIILRGEGEPFELISVDPFEKVIAQLDDSAFFLCTDHNPVQTVRRDADGKEIASWYTTQYFVRIDQDLSLYRDDSPDVNKDGYCLHPESGTEIDYVEIQDGELAKLRKAGKLYETKIVPPEFDGSDQCGPYTHFGAATDLLNLDRTVFISKRVLEENSAEI